MTLLQQAMNLYSSGMLAEALRLAQYGLAIEPQNEAALCEVAAASAYALGDHAQAERSWKRVIALEPDSVAAHQSMGIFLASTGRELEAEAHFRRATVLNPRFAQAFYCLGRCLAAGSESAEAESSLRKALALDPNLAPAHFCLGALMFKAGRSDEAEKCYRRAIALDAEMAEAFNNLGDVLSQSGRSHEAEECFRRAIALDQNFADARYNLGNLLSAKREFEEAERCYRHALAANPGFVDGYLNLGRLLSQIERHEEAEAGIRRAIALDSENPKAHEALGDFLYGRWRFREAEIALRKAMALHPECARLLPQVVCAANYQHAWGRRDEDLRQMRELFSGDRPVRCTPLALLAIDGISALEQKEASRISAEEIWKVGLGGARIVQAGASRPHARLRIGYLSAHFHFHAVSLAIAGVLEAHDRSKVEIHGYSYGPDLDDEERKRVRAACASFRDLRLMSDEAAARLIASDEIDILVDLVGYTSGYRPLISALRPAPVIVNWLGYPGTLGHELLADYLIGDPVVTPLAHAGHFSETLALMPHYYAPYDRSRTIAPRPSRREAGLPESGFIFCSFHQGYKLNPQVFDVWCRLLREVPHSVLWLQKQGEDAIANLRREAMQRAVDPDRLIFAAPVRPAEFLGRLQVADLALDTHPYGSHTTGADVLWAGLPMVTKIGETFASRVAASLLHAVGMPELVTEDWDGYFSLAKRLALDPGLLAAARRKLAASRLTAPLFDTPGFTRDLEDLYLAIWRQHRSGAAGPVVLAPRSLVDAD